MESKGHRIQHLGLSYLLTLVFLVAEHFIWSEALAGNITLLEAIGLHALISAICIFILIKGWGGRYLYLIALLIVVMGPFGAAMGLAILVLYTLYAFVIDPVTNLIRELMPELSKSKSEALYDRIQTGMEGRGPGTEVTPLMDIIEFGTNKQKLDAIEKMLHYYHPEYLPALKKAVTDKNNAVRVMAATSIASLEDSLHKKFLKLEENCRHLPNDAPTILRFANHCFDYSKFNVFEDERLQKIRNIAIEKYQEYLNLRPEDKQVYYQLGCLYSDNGDYTNAKKAFELLEKTPETFTLKVYLELMKVYFENQEYSKMHSLTNNHFSKLSDQIDDTVDPESQDILFSWGDLSSPLDVEEAKNAGS